MAVVKKGRNWLVLDEDGNEISRSRIRPEDVAVKPKKKAPKKKVAKK